MKQLFVPQILGPVASRSVDGLVVNCGLGFRVSIRLTVSGGSACQRKLVRVSVRWFERAYVSAPPRLPVELRVGLVSTVLEEQEVGCAFEGDCLFGRSFQVYLQKGLVCEGDLAVTCLHEMVHMNQMLSRNLELNRDTSFIPYWRGRDASHYSYSRQSGGRQAHYLENRLMNEFKVSGEFASQQNCLGECAFV